MLVCIYIVPDILRQGTVQLEACICNLNRTCGDAEAVCHILESLNESVERKRKGLSREYDIPYALVEYRWCEAASNMVAQPMQLQLVCDQCRLLKDLEPPVLGTDIECWTNYWPI